MIALGMVALTLAAARGGDCSKELQRLVKGHARELLSEYRMPSRGDVIGLWAAYVRARGVCPYLTSGDYNEDGIPDFAFILPSRKDGYGVFALLSLTKGYALQRLERSEQGLASKRGMVYDCPIPPLIWSVPEPRPRPGPEALRGRLCVGGESPQSYDYDGLHHELRPTPKYVF